MADARSAEHDAVAEQLAQTFARTWNDRDGAGYGEAYWPDAELVDPTGQIWEGQDAIVQMHVALWNGPARETRVRPRVRRVRALAVNVIIVDLEIDVSGSSPAPPGVSVQSDGSVKARLKQVVDKRADDWKIVASQNTFVAAPPPGA
jgi:uncharacterized protein (TIGR02246 family)